MISQVKQKGFTIVELLIVIVVIAILAAISIAAYTSITARANDSTAAATAKTVKDVAQTYQGANGSFPTTRAQFRTGGDDPVAKLPNDIVFVGGTPYAGASNAAQALTDDSTGKAAKKVLVYPCSTNGFRIYYKSFTSTDAKSVDVGDCTTAPSGNSMANS